MKQHLDKIFLAIALLIVSASCSNNTVFSEYVTLPENGWSKDSTANFSFSVPNGRVPYDLLVNVRHRGDFKTQNLWLFISTETPDSVVKNDTIEFFLANERGKWLGSGFGSLYNMSVLAAQQQRFVPNKSYKVSIRHGMRDSLLTGINDIGLEVIQAKQ
ncbi:MAG: gliding motility lipoprotein GldH [Prevotellaceae bacterium]|jgi:gliding motility-associated lipoprotein GldH|nr:gliding motility lipoprotein GldH [Prevotellaceae bacterium]